MSPFNNKESTPETPMIFINENEWDLCNDVEKRILFLESFAIHAPDLLARL
jgi:hypothetical protein